MRPTADDGLTDGLRREGCLVWNTALVPMVSLAETPLTGKPDAGNPPVRFGGRGSGNAALPTPIVPFANRGQGQDAPVSLFRAGESNRDHCAFVPRQILSSGCT